MPHAPTLEEEESLIERARRGDGEAFGILFDAFKDAIYRTVILPRVRNVSAAEEVLQETFLLALEKIDGFKWTDRSIFFWLRMIAINKSREWAAGAARHSTVDDVVLDFHPDRTFQPENAAVLKDYQRELRGKIEDILGDINERYRDAIRLRLIERKSREDSAAALGLSIETFDVVFFRACKSFKKEYIKKYGEEF